MPRVIDNPGYKSDLVYKIIHDSGYHFNLGYKILI